MSDEKNKKGEKTFWEESFQGSDCPKGPEKPWSSEMESQAENVVNFLQDSGNKQKLKDFIVETYKEMESQKAGEFKARVLNEMEVNSNRKEEYHTPSNITPLLAKTFNMFDTEQAFARGMQATYSNLTRSVEDRVEEINRLLSGIGGFSSQLRGCFARSTVVFLEQDDPTYPFRERLIFSVHLPSYELKNDWSRNANGEKDAYGRTTLQATWDDAVNALAQIIETSGLKPKYCKNDRNYGRFVMKQDLRSSSVLPDEYFSITLDYNTSEKIKDMCSVYNRIFRRYEQKLRKAKKKLDSYPLNSESPKYARIKRKYFSIEQEKDYFLGTIPDPNQLEEGLLLVIEVSTLKDYHIVKDRMQSIMTKFILHLSKIASHEAERNPNLAYELWKSGKINGESSDKNGKLISERELSSIQEYVVDESALKLSKRKKVA
ncbi:MAG: hypothetical protein JXA66_08335 [Oligoflexia bacterium]|nr:hypothetical protein [Oligoflexia bacterium]